jgi:hypothetical protein
MTRARPGSGRFRGLGALIALLALAMNILSPPGFMTAVGRGGPTIVICTGHGPATAPDPAGRADHHGGHHPGQAGACAFAGHGLASAPPPLAIASAAAFAPTVPTAPALRDLAPGRGLAAPPPPSRGPPRLT